MTKIALHSTVKMISTDGDYRAEGKLGMKGKVTVLTSNTFWGVNLLTVLLDDGTQVDMFDYRFELVEEVAAPQPVAKVKKTKAKKAGTKIAKLRAHLLSGRSITQLEAIGLYGAYRLAARIFDLKEEGMKIVTKIKEDPNGDTYAEYSLRSKRVG